MTSIAGNIDQLAHMDESLAAMRQGVASLQENLRAHDAVNVSLFGEKGARVSELLRRSDAVIGEASDLMFAAQAKLVVGYLDLQRVIGDRA